MPTKAVLCCDKEEKNGEELVLYLEESLQGFLRDNSAVETTVAKLSAPMLSIGHFDFGSSMYLFNKPLR